jgi:hypothetical protein
MLAFENQKNVWCPEMSEPGSGKPKFLATGLVSLVINLNRPYVRPPSQNLHNVYVVPRDGSIGSNYLEQTLLHKFRICKQCAGIGSEILQTEGHFDHLIKRFVRQEHGTQLSLIVKEVKQLLHGHKLHV